MLNLADELGNISKACKMMGVSRGTFYRYKEAVDDGGIESLFDQNRRIPNPKNRVDPLIESAVVAYAIDQPAHGQVRVSNELRNPLYLCNIRAKPMTTSFFSGSVINVSPETLDNHQPQTSSSRADGIYVAEPALNVQ